MRNYRLMLGERAGLLALLLVFALGNAGCGQQAGFRGGKTPGKRTVPCETTIKVDPGAVHGVDKAAIYICDDAGYNKVSWVAPPGLTFSVNFPSTSSTDCPFSPCPASITDGTPQTVAPQPNGLIVYKYTITVTTGGTSHTFDPHVVGGGGT